MKNFILIHGAHGHPKENWFPWLKDQLKELWNKVVIPQFPTPEWQDLDNWMKEFDKYLSKIDENTILIWHSIGVGFILNILEKIDKKIDSCYLVAWFANLLNHPIDEINSSFVNKEFDWAKIKAHCQNFNIFHSDNDPFVPFKHWSELAEQLWVWLILVEWAWHFNENAGYKQFDLLLDKIKEKL